ncbi:hypothetical protein [Yinghuangia seranimata]|uniref:hypothetical protein n=1 Tax=Yinghuangia seranimata TaxID=408067 RepID=UPI00248CB830|nr:hypothetical protein [Yinghuangia seranimata]MDI2131286.1 hypothetical protein [Yinghuangia seranimata]
MALIALALLIAVHALACAHAAWPDSTANVDATAQGFARATPSCATPVRAVPDTNPTSGGPQQTAVAVAAAVLVDEPRAAAPHGGDDEAGCGHPCAQAGDRAVAGSTVCAEAPACPAADVPCAAAPSAGRDAPSSFVAGTLVGPRALLGVWRT